MTTGGHPPPISAEVFLRSAARLKGGDDYEQITSLAHPTSTNEGIYR